jgi:uncharacterized iron-regulated membrane protein
MKGKEKRKSQAKTIRLYRKAHRTTGIFLFVFLFIVAITAILLGWKKHSAGILLPETQQGTSSNFEDWMPLEKLHDIAFIAIRDSLPLETEPVLDRIDIRKNKGILKFTFSNTYLEVQLDGVTGKTLSLGQRRSDFIESLHDGSILDKLFKTGNGQIKVVYTSILGLGLLFFTISGFWLWYGPKRMKKTIRDHGESH